MCVRVRFGLTLGTGAEFNSVKVRGDYPKILSSVLGLGTIDDTGRYGCISPSDCKPCMTAMPL